MTSKIYLELLNSLADEERAQMAEVYMRVLTLLLETDRCATAAQKDNKNGISKAKMALIFKECKKVYKDKTNLSNKIAQFISSKINKSK